MLNSGNKFRALRDKKKNILTLMLSEKIILNETKNHNPPFKLNGRSLTTDIPNNTEGICVVCNRHFSDIFVHACCSCPSTQVLQEAWWDMMIEQFNLDLYVEISQYDNEQRYQILLGKKPRTDIDELDYERLLKLCHCHLIYCIT